MHAKCSARHAVYEMRFGGRGRMLVPLTSGYGIISCVDLVWLDLSLSVTHNPLPWYLVISCLSFTTVMNWLSFGNTSLSHTYPRIFSYFLRAHILRTHWYVRGYNPTLRELTGTYPT